MRHFKTEKSKPHNLDSLTLSLPVTHICVNFSTVYNDTLVAKGLRYILLNPPHFSNQIHII